jgi:hypothetical protein
MPFSAPRPHALSALLVALMLASTGCDRPQTTPDNAHGATASPATATSSTQTSTTATSPDAETRSLEAVGDRCFNDTQCPGYLRCVDRACAVPPAITGEADESTPRIVIHDKPSQSASKDAHTFKIELATEPHERQRGLMFRRSMEDDWGMLFIYDREQPLGFWMENTYIPLDMIFIDARGEIVTIVADVPPMTRETRESTAPARYVLELDAGTAAKQGIEVGDWISLVNVPPRYRPRR